MKGYDLKEMTEDRNTEMSQVQVIGLPSPKSWDDYENGCIATYKGGHNGLKLDAFRHGMITVFNLLRNEFPPAEKCKYASELFDACKGLIDDLHIGKAIIKTYETAKDTGWELRGSRVSGNEHTVKIHTILDCVVETSQQIKGI